MPIINLTDEQFNAAENFARQLVAKQSRRNYYQQERNAPADHWLIKQTTNSKLAEFAAAEYLCSLGLPVSFPDLIVNTNDERKQIGFDADLTSFGNRYHVKSWCVDHNIRESYTFQLSDPLLRSKSRHDYVVCVRVDSDERRCEIRAVLVWGDWRDRLKQPKLAIHYGKKMVLQWYDMSASI